MRRMLSLGIISLLFPMFAFAIPPVVMSGPTPALSSSYSAETTTTLTYVITNNTPFTLPITVGGISNPITRTTVAHDCGNYLAPSPSTCNIGISIQPSTSQTGSVVNQTLQVDYKGRLPLKSVISFSVSGLFAYVTPALDATSIDQFALGNDGLLLSYTPAYTATGSEVFGQMTFATVDGVQYAYILNPGGAVYKCTINADGSFSNCQAMAGLPTLGTWQARGIAFATFDAQYAYIVDGGDNQAYQCALDISGNFSTCFSYNLPTQASYGIAFATDADGAQQAYIADAGPNPSHPPYGDVWLCPMNNDGSFILPSCTPTPSSGSPNWIPYAVAFTTVNGIQYAYVADNGTGVPGHVYKCALDNNGTLSACVQTPINDSSLTNWYPYYIAFQTVNGTKYAYVVNSAGSSVGNIYRCPVNNTGALTNCVMTPTTPPTPWQPTGIAFR